MSYLFFQGYYSVTDIILAVLCIWRITKGGYYGTYKKAFLWTLKHLRYKKLTVQCNDFDTNNTIAVKSHLIINQHKTLSSPGSEIQVEYGCSD